MYSKKSCRSGLLKPYQKCERHVCERSQTIYCMQQGNALKIKMRMESENLHLRNL